MADWDSLVDQSRPLSRANDAHKRNIGEKMERAFLIEISRS